MATIQKSRLKDGLVQNPAQVSNALANILSIEGGREQVLGQAWLAAPGRLITCGHVVERYVNAVNLLIVRFPASGNKYQINRIKLHPSYVRQPDQLVKFDVALLELNLQAPESSAEALPFSYEQPFSTNQTLWAIRYPAHLGQLSAAPQPLTQDGRYLGPLRIHDTFHLLHDLPLSPGDSGAPISDGNVIVAVHCGDTATIPGLNLPTTSIRLALWVDALRELGIQETASSQGAGQQGSLLPALLAFLLSALLVGFGLYSYYGQEGSKHWVFSNPEAMPIEISFNKAYDEYDLGEDIHISITPHANYHVFLLNVSQADKAAVLYPQYGLKSLTSRGEPLIIHHLGTQKLAANPDKDTCWLLAIRANAPQASEISQQVISESDWPSGAKEGVPLTTRASELIKRFKSIKEAHPDDVILSSFDAPRSKSN